MFPSGVALLVGLTGPAIIRVPPPIRLCLCALENKGLGTSNSWLDVSTKGGCRRLDVSTKGDCERRAIAPSSHSLSLTHVIAEKRVVAGVYMLGEYNGFATITSNSGATFILSCSFLIHTLGDIDARPAFPMH